MPGARTAAGRAIRVFESYAHEDSALKDRITQQLKTLQRNGLIRSWHDRMISGGQEWKAEINRNLERADLVLLFVSPAFLASDYCYDVEMKAALARHFAREARVVPIILRHCLWQESPLSRLQALPAGGRPVAAHADLDEACAEVARAVLRVAEELRAGTATAYDQDSRVLELGLKLEAAYDLKEKLEVAGDDSSAVVSDILAIRRELREGGRLKNGDILAGRLALKQVLGEGGFATVWLAYHRRLHTPVAVKVLHGQFAHDASRRERFFRGARKLSELRHPHVVRVIEAEGEDAGWYFFVMEYVAGGDLHRGVVDGRVSGQRGVAILARTARALQHAHDQGLVHRDVTPSNILIGSRDDCWLTDFDLVRAFDTTGGTRTGAMGKVWYSAPEILESPQSADRRADVFSLGMTAYFVLAGKDPSPQVFFDRARHFEKLTCSRELRDVLVKATQWAAAERLDSAALVAEALEREETRMRPAPVWSGVEVSHPDVPHSVLTPKAFREVCRLGKDGYPSCICGFITGPRGRDVADRVQACVNIQDRLHAEDPSRHPRDSRTAWNLDAHDIWKLAMSFKTDQPAKVIYSSHIDVGAFLSDSTRQGAIMDGEPAYPVDLLILDARSTGVQGATQYAWDVRSRDYVEVRRYEPDR